jgi:hypothetical protein
MKKLENYLSYQIDSAYTLSRAQCLLNLNSLYVHI